MRSLKIVDDFDPIQIYNELIKRCMEVRTWNIRCIIEESWVGIAPFHIMIIDGIFHCTVVAPTLKEAYIQVSEKLPVIRFLDYRGDIK